jgi:hypothetical protein
MPTIESEAHELLIGASKAIRTNKELAELQTVPEIQEALDELINLHPHSPYTIAMCSFLLGVYVAFQYHDMKHILNELGE